VLSLFEYDNIPSMSEVLIPASVAALRSAHVPSARVVLPDPRVYVVSPTPTIAYLSRRYFGVLTSVSAGNGMARPLFLVVRLSEMLIFARIAVNPGDFSSPSARTGCNLHTTGG
jgi:hypothetical protein